VTLHSRLLDLLKSADSALGIPLARALEGPARPLPENPRDVLCLRLWGLGNLVLLGPLFALAGERRVRLVTLARHADFMRRHFPRVELLLLPEPPSLALPLALLSVARSVRSAPPDLVVDAEQFLRLPLILLRAACDAPVVGMDTPGQGRAPLLDRAVRYDPTRHVADTFLALAHAGRLPAVPGPVRLAPSPEERAALLRRLDAGEAHAAGARRGPQSGPLVVLHPGSGDHFPGRRWPPARFGKLAARLARECGARIVLTGVRAEAPLVRAVACAAGVPVLDLCGTLDARALVALLAEADLLVANDTGPVHLADAVGTACVALYGPNTPHRYGPRGPHTRALFADLPCSPCLDDRTMKRSACRHHACMLALQPDDVEGACRALLARRRVDAARLADEAARAADPAADAAGPVAHAAQATDAAGAAHTEDADAIAR
jgi:heptosyltransferase-2